MRSVSRCMEPAMILVRNLVALSVLFCLEVAMGSGQSPISKDAQARMEKVVTCLPAPVMVKGDPASACIPLAERMAALHVPGVSIAVVHNGVIEWAQGFGVQQVGGKPVNAETMFQAGSISKPVSAMAALRQVQLGKLGLDTDVNTELTSWKVPTSTVAPGAVVTLRELLTHTAGFTVHGFPGYAQGAPVPTLVQVLDGEKPANTPAIRLMSVPGSTWNYSGGGYTVMLQVVLDAVKEPFPKLMRDTVLGPMGMTHSTYEQPLPVAMQANAATPYAANGTAIAGGAHTYPEMTAAGLWTTASDLARYIVENQQSLQGKANHVLSREMTEQMMTPGKGSWGLGVQIGGKPENPYFTHGGVNEGFEALFVGSEKNGEGAAVMTNAQGGSRLADEVMRSIAAAYDWPDFRDHKPVERTVVKVDPAVLAKYVGTYDRTDTPTPAKITITLENGQLMMQREGQEKREMFAESDDTFFLMKQNVELQFKPNRAGVLRYLAIDEDGRQTIAAKE
jgi:CubicO group peptidase (beta-lactamase class C family)